MEPLEAHERAQRAFSTVLAEVDPAHLDAATPCSDWTVRQLIDHVVGGNNRVAGAAATASGAAGGEGGADLVEAHLASAERAGATFAAPGAMTQVFVLPFGEVPGSRYAGMRATDAFAHAWDLARATGQSTELDPELATELLAWSRLGLSPEFRGQGRPFGDEQPCPPEAAPADRLAAFLGRAVS